MEESCVADCPHYDRHFKQQIAELAESSKPKQIGVSTWVSIASVALVALAMLWNMAANLGEMKEKQVASDQKIDLILGALHLVPATATSTPTAVSARRQQQ